MTVLRALGKGFGSFIVVLALASALAAMALAQLTDYGALKPAITEALALQMPVNETELTAMLVYLRGVCAETRNESIFAPFFGQNVTLRCAELAEIGPAELPGLIVEKVFDQLYYKSYDCAFIDCLRAFEEPEERAAVLLSAHANSFFNSIAIYLLIATVLGAMIVAVAAGNIPGALKALGICLIIVGVGYFALGPIRDMLPIPPEAAATAAALLDPPFATLATNFMYTLIAGIAMLASGIAADLMRKRAKGQLVL
jgi:hypothetical protein